MIRIVKSLVIPRWWMAETDMLRVYTAFQDLLANLTLSHTDLARDIGVDQSTVSRWAVGKSNPQPEQMKKLIAALQSRLKTVAETAERTSRAVDALVAVVGVFEHAMSQVADGSEGEVDSYELAAAAQTLDEVLNEIGPSQAARKGQRRQRRKHSVKKR